MSYVTSSSVRVLVVLGGYVALVFVAVLFFSWVRQGVGDDSPVRYAYTLSGPALALYTHMGFYLFISQSLLLMPWLLVSAFRPQLRKQCAIGFCITWLGIGWYMHNLF